MKSPYSLNRQRKFPIVVESSTGREEARPRVDVCTTVAIKITEQRGWRRFLRSVSRSREHRRFLFSIHISRSAVEGSRDVGKKPTRERIEGKNGVLTGIQRERERERGGLKRSRRFPDPVYRLLPSFAETIVENLERQCESCLQPPTQRTNNRTAGLFLCGFAFHLLCSAHPLLFSARRRCVLLSFSLLLRFFPIPPPSVLFCFCSGWILALKGNEHRIKSHVHIVHYHRSKRK